MDLYAIVDYCNRELDPISTFQRDTILQIKIVIVMEKYKVGTDWDINKI